VAAEEEGQETEQAEQESDHRAEIVRGSEPTNQSLDCRTGFWRKTATHRETLVLMTANARIRANVRADAFGGVLAWPMADLQKTPIGDLMARIVGNVEVLGVGIREFTIEIWDTVLFSLSFVVALLVFDPGLTLVALLPVPCRLRAIPVHRGTMACR